MSDFPCKNPSCKSFGMPHPNCQCHAGMAKGGVAEPFCSDNKMHDHKCSYAINPIDIVNELYSPKKDPQHTVNGYIADEGLHGLIDHHALHDGKKYEASSMRGHKNADRLLSAIFSGEKIPKKDISSQHKKIKDWLEKGGVTHDLQDEIYKHHEPKMFAKGGEVEESKIHNSGVSLSHPEHNMIMQSSKANIEKYLHALRPQENEPRLAFDAKPDQTQKKKSYDKALHIAANPLNILHEINHNTIENEHVHHFKAMFPELDHHLQNKITEKVIEAQLKGKKPSYQMRQGMSKYLGVPLSSEMSQQNINAAQSIFQSSQHNQTPAPETNSKSKKGSPSLSNSDQSFLTGNQALTERQQRK